MISLVLEMRSMERGICPIATSTMNELVPIIMAGCIAHTRNGRICTSGLKSDVTIVNQRVSGQSEADSTVYARGRTTETPLHRPYVSPIVQSIDKSKTISM